MSALPLDGKVALLTGAGGGLGGALAFALANAGATVALQCRKSVASADRVRLGVLEHGGAAHLYRSDLAEEAAVRRLVDGVRADLGRVDVLVNGAGSSLVKPALETDVGQWERVLRDNLTSAFLCARAVAEGMIVDGGGAIVNVASIAGVLGLRNRAAYCAAKAGLLGLTRALAAEWADVGVRVNAVAPGVVETESVAEALRSGAASAADALQRTPLGRLATPAEVGEAVCFLASPASSYMTGHCLAVDGGWSTFAGDALRPLGPAGNRGEEVSAGSRP